MTSAALLPVGALALVLSLAVQCAMLAVPLLTMHVYDGILTSRNMDTLAGLALVYAAAALLGGVLRLLRSSLIAAAAGRLGRHLQLAVPGAAIRSALGGDRSRGMTGLQDAAEVRRLLGGSTVSDLFDLVAVPAALTVLHLLHPLYGAVALGGCLLFAALGALADRTTRNLVRKAGEVQSRCVADLAGRMRLPDLLEGLGMLPAVMRRWRVQQAHALERHDAAQRRARALQGLSAFSGQALQMAMVAAGAWLVTRHEASQGSILAAALLAGMATAPGARLVATWRDWAYGAVAWRRLHALVTDHALPQPVPPAPDAVPGLRIQGVTIAPPGTGRVLVRNLDLDLHPGDVLLVAGPNGVGKTSLLRVLLGLTRPAEGRVLLHGQDTWRSDHGALGPRIGYLPQGAQLLDASVLDNIARFEAAPPDAAVAAARRAGAHEMIGRLPQGYAAPAGPSAGLSGGQRQLIALARAMYGSPTLLVLDEPEAGLDAPGLDALRAAVTAAKQEGAIVVLVTHQPADWAGIVDRRLNVSGGGMWSEETAGAPTVLTSSPDTKED